MACSPKPLRGIQRIDVEFAAALVKLAMVSMAERHGDLVTHFATERVLLREPEMVGIRRTATAGQAGLGAFAIDKSIFGRRSAQWNAIAVELACGFALISGGL